MHIPMQVDYGVRALVDLAANGGEGPVRATDISKRQGIPEPYLAQVLHSLRKRGLTTTQRGPLGGHSLALEPSEISMGMVMEYLGGTQAMVGCFDDQGHCTQSPACGQRNPAASCNSARCMDPNGRCRRYGSRPRELRFL